MILAGDVRMRNPWRLSPFLILTVIAGVVRGAVVPVWAKNIGISAFAVPTTAPFRYPGKEVGFVRSPNWLVGLILMPLPAAPAIVILQRGQQALRAMHRLGMVVDDDFRPLTDAALARIWRRLANGAVVGMA